MRKFWAAFISGLLIFVALNVAPLWLYSTSSFRTVGFPKKFWTEINGSERFDKFNLGLDLFFAVYLSYRLGLWYRNRGTPDYLSGEKT